MSWFDKLNQTFIEGDRYLWILDGLKNTIIITLGALIIGVLIGTVIAITKYFCDGDKKLRIFSLICDFYTTVIRGIPITVLLLMFFYIILVSADGVAVAIIAFGINSGAYMAELIRSGINAVDKGQMEAARSLGMSKGQAMAKIIFPQAIKNILPTLGNEFIALVKETSVVSFVGATDLYVAFNLIGSNSYEFMVPYIAMALIYILLVLIISAGIKLMERSLRKSDRRN